MPGALSTAAAPWRIAAAGMLSLATAMGIGRFAFTPLLPMMLADGTLDIAGASWLASANYLGYLVGALLCTVQPWIWSRLALSRPLRGTSWVRGGLVATCLLTLGMALHWPVLWPLLRFAAGVASAVVFVYTSGFCLAQLARRGLPEMGALIYTGPGIGILVSGLAGGAMATAHWPAVAGWAIFGVLAAVLTALVWGVFRPEAEAGPSPASPPAPASAPASTSASSPVAAAAAAHGHGAAEVALLALAYGFAGFGYIITATFLPVIARQALPGSPWLDFFWPLFGLGVVLGALLASRLRTHADLRWLLAACYLVQAFGIAVGLWSPSLFGFAFGSLLLGLPFTAITFFAMQEARRLRPLQAASTMGLLTALYGLGQIAGPPLTAALLARSATPSEGFTLSLEIAAGSLLLGAGLYAAMTRWHPVKRPA